MKILAKLRLYRRFDPRLAGELRKQRKTILIGLICVVIGAMFDALFLPLIKTSVSLIDDAAPTKLHRQEHYNAFRDELDKQAEKIGSDLGLPVEKVQAAFHKIQAQIKTGQASVTSQLLARELNKDPVTVRAAFMKSAGRETGNVDKVRQLAFCCVLVIVLYSCRYWFIRGQVYYLSKASIRLTSDLRSKLFVKLQRLPVAYFTDKRTGAIQSVLTNDVNVYQNAVGVLRDSVNAPITAAISFGYIIYEEPRLALISAVFLPPIAMVIDRNGKRMKRSQSSVQEDLAELSAVTTEALQGKHVSLRLFQPNNGSPPLIKRKSRKVLPARFARRASSLHCGHWWNSSARGQLLPCSLSAATWPISASWS